MKKYLFMATLAVAAFGFTSCDDDDSKPALQEAEISNGVVVINSGNKGSGINGSITYLNYESGSVFQGVYEEANGESLGGTVNDGVISGSKAYILGSDEKVVFVADRNTMKAVTKISFSETPRHIIADGGYVYVSTFDGKAYAIDTLSYTKKAYSCGTYSEGMAVCDGYLYVADSDYGRGNASISKIDLAKGTTETIKDANIRNCVDVFCYNNTLYFLDSGEYEAGTWKQIKNGVYKLNADNTTEKVADATFAALTADGVFYLINAPYAGDGVTYTTYDLKSGKSAQFIDGTDIASPAGIGVDPEHGYVVITSYNLVGGYASYSTNGYAVQYSSKGEKMRKFETGVGPVTVRFDIAKVMK